MPVAELANGELRFHCPGCKCLHNIPAEHWHWNESLDTPTLSPSVRHYHPAYGKRPEQTICHYHIEDGVIKYCPDCQHEYAGKRVPMILLPEKNDT